MKIEYFQIQLTINANDGVRSTKYDLVGRIEEPRDPDFVTVATLSTFPPTSSATTTATAVTTATAAAVQTTET